MKTQMTKLKAGQRPPVFELKDIFGHPVDLETYRDSKLLIGFFRHAGCPFCNIRIHRLLQVYNELRGKGLDGKGLEMIFFFESPDTLLLQSRFHQGLSHSPVSSIPLISDPDKKWYAAYGLQESLFRSAVSHLTGFLQTAYRSARAGLPTHAMKKGESIATMPAEFLISEGLVIADAYYSDGLNDRLDVRTIKEWVENGHAESGLAQNGWVESESTGTQGLFTS